MGTKLTKSSRDKKIMGVCGGIAEYLHIDSTLVRIIWAIAVCCFGSGLLLYFIAGIIMPQDFGQTNNNWNNQNNFNNNYNGYSDRNYDYNSGNNYNNRNYNYNYNNNNGYYSNSNSYYTENNSNTGTNLYSERK